MTDPARESNKRSQAYAVIWGALLFFFITVMVLLGVVPPTIFGVSSALLVSALAGFAFVAVIYRFVPRCTLCGLGYFSLVELGGVPIIMKSWVGARCVRCGNSLR